MLDAQTLGCSFKTQTRQARWDSEGRLKKKKQIHHNILTQKQSDLSQGFANSRPIGRGEHHGYEVFQKKQTKDSIWCTYCPLHQLLNTLETRNKGWVAGLQTN